MAGNQKERPLHKEVLKDMQYNRSRKRRALRAVQGKDVKKPQSREKYKKSHDVETIEEKRKQKKPGSKG